MNTETVLVRVGCRCEAAHSLPYCCSGLNLANGESTVLKLTKAKLGNYIFDWAMLVCETM
jgi:hypothetical protein